MLDTMQVEQAGADALAALLDSTTGELAGAFERIGWGEDEIARAIRRHPGHRDVLWHAFKLLSPRELGTGIYTEFVYRSHAAELLERVASAADTRPATAAELVVVCGEASHKAPMHSAGAGLYFRMWLKAFPNHPLTSEHAAQQVHYEKLFAASIDEMEAELRRKVADPDRRMGDKVCEGKHHGEPVECRFARQS